MSKKRISRAERAIQLIDMIDMIDMGVITTTDEFQNVLFGKCQICNKTKDIGFEMYCGEHCLKISKSPLFKALAQESECENIRESAIQGP